MTFKWTLGVQWLVKSVDTDMFEVNNKNTRLTIVRQLIPSRKNQSFESTDWFLYDRIIRNK